MKNNPFPTEEKRDDNLFVVQNAIEAIQAWKSHQIKMVNQENGKYHGLFQYV